MKKSEVDSARALKLQKADHFDEAFEEFDAAARLVPKNLEDVTSLAMVRQQLVFNHLQRGSDDLTRGKNVQAQAEFRSAASLDRENEFAQQRLRDSLTEWAPRIAGGSARVLNRERYAWFLIRLRKFHFRGTRMLC